MAQEQESEDTLIEIGEQPEPEPAVAETTAEPVAVEPAPDPQTSGILRDLQDERAKRQQAQQEAAELKFRLDLLEKASAPNVEEDPDDVELAQLQDGDLLEVGKARKLVTKLINKGVSEGLHQHQVVQSMKAARKAHTDFQATVDAAAKFMTAGDWEYAERSDDPGETAYQLARERNPETKNASLAQMRDQIKAEILKELGIQPQPTTAPQAAPKGAPVARPADVHRAALTTAAGKLVSAMYD